MLQPIPTDRISAADALRDPWFAEMASTDTVTKSASQASSIATAKSSLSKHDVGMSSKGSYAELNGSGRTGRGGDGSGGGAEGTRESRGDSLKKRVVDSDGFEELEGFEAHR